MGNDHYAPTLCLAVRHSTNAGTLGGPKTSTLLGAVFGGGGLFRTKAVHDEVREPCHVKPIQASG
jgi:hypothetical protein